MVSQTSELIASKLKAGMWTLMSYIGLSVLTMGCFLNPRPSELQNSIPNLPQLKILWTPVIIQSPLEIKAALLQLNPHPTVTHIVWAEGQYPSTDNKVAVVRLSGVDTVAWVGSRWNPYVAIKVVQASDTLNKPALPSAVIATRGKIFRY